MVRLLPFHSHFVNCEAVNRCCCWLAGRQMVGAGRRGLGDGVRVCSETPDSSENILIFVSASGLAHARSCVYIINNAKTGKMGKFRGRKCGKNWDEGRNEDVHLFTCHRFSEIEPPTKYRIAEPSTQQQAVGTILSFITISLKTTTTTTTGRIGVR